MKKHKLLKGALIQLVHSYVFHHTIVLPFVCCSFSFAIFPPNPVGSLPPPPTLYSVALISYCALTNSLYCVCNIWHSWVLSLHSVSVPFDLSCWFYIQYNMPKNIESFVYDSMVMFILRVETLLTNIVNGFDLYESSKLCFLIVIPATFWLSNMSVETGKRFSKISLVNVTILHSLIAASCNCGGWDIDIDAHHDPTEFSYASSKLKSPIYRLFRKTKNYNIPIKKIHKASWSSNFDLFK